MLLRINCNNLKTHLSAERVFTYISSFLFPSKSRGDNRRHSRNHSLLFHRILVPAAPLPLLTWEVQRRGVRSGRHGAPGDRHRRLLLGGGGFFANLPGGGNPTALPRSARNPSSHAAGGGGARRTKREERGRRGGGPGATGPRPGLGRAEARGSESAASDWRSLSPSRCTLGLAGPLGQAKKWRTSLAS